MGDFLQNVPIEANNTIVLLVRKVCLIKINKKGTSESINKSYSPIRVHQNPPFFWNMKQPKRQIFAPNVMAIRDQRHNVDDPVVVLNRYNTITMVLSIWNRVDRRSKYTSKVLKFEVM